MLKRIQKLKSLLALTMCAAMILTAVPDAALVSAAAEAEDVVAEVVAGEEADVVSETEAVADETAESTEAEAEVEEATEAETVVEESSEVVESAVEESSEAVESSVEESSEVVEESALSDEVVEIKEYQTTKLKVTKKQTTVFAGEENVEFAQIAYEATTKNDGKGYNCYVYDSQGYSVSGIGVLSRYSTGYDPEKVIVSVDNDVAAGKYTLYLSPVAPEGVRVETVTVPLTVKAGINDIELTAPSRVYKAENKAASFKVTAVLESYSAKAPAVKKLNWEAFWDDDFKQPCDAKEVKVANGKVTIDKSFQVSEGKDKLYIKATAADFEKNTAYNWVRVTLAAKALEPAALVLTGSGGIVEKNSFTVAEAEELGLRVKVQDAEKQDMSLTAFTYTSSNAKAIKVNKYGFLEILQATGKPVTITATAVDGSKKKVTTKITIEKKKMEIANVGLKVAFDSSDEEIDLKGDKTEGTFSTYSNADLLYVTIYDTTDGYDVLDASVSKIKGGKDITAKYIKAMNWGPSGISPTNPAMLGTMTRVIIPTAGTVEITAKAGKDTKVFKLKNTNFSEKKIKAPKAVTLQKTYDEQEVKIYVGAEYKDMTAVFEYDYNSLLANETGLYSQYVAEELGLLSNQTVGADGYVTFTCSNAGSWDPIFAYWFNMKAPSSVKANMIIVNAEGVAQTATTMVTYKFAASKKAKSDFKLKTDYTLDNMTATFDGEDKQIIGAKVTYSGSKAPKAKLVYVSLEGGLSKDLLEADAWVQSVKVDHVWNEEKGETTIYLEIDESGIEKLRAAYGAGKASTTMYMTYCVNTGSDPVYKTEKVKITYTIPEASTTEP